MTCNVRQNTINTLKEKKIIDDNLFVISPLFWEENRKFSNLARTKYKVQNQGLLFFTETTKNDKVKAVPNEVFFKELQQRFDVQNLEVPSIGSRDNLEYQLKVVNIVSKNIEKINDWYKKIGNTGVFWNKLQQDLQIPKEQVELLKESEGTNIEEKLASFVANYSFAIEINITKQNTGNLSDRIGDFVNDSGTWINVKEYRDATEEEAEILNKKIREQNVNTKEYANMTVPGGTNYTENEIATPGRLVEEKPQGTEVKQGVNGVFEQSPELANIGTQEQYSQYLNTIFPDSKVKDIVAHGTNADFEKFDKSFYSSGDPDHIYFGIKGKLGFKSFAKRTIYALVNIKNPNKFINNGSEKVENSDGFIEDYTPDFFDNLTDDQEMGGEFLTQIGVKEPEQIHILGSKQDIEGFNKWIKDNTKTVRKGAITPSIKGHAQFATDNGIGWFRSDDKHAFTGFLEDLIASGTIKKVPCG